jgi:predicted enzyme related to lactoylglutathione lyase
VAAGDLVYFWLSTRDAEKAKQFYGGLLGWRFSEGNAPGGWNVEGSTPPGGLHGGGGEARANVCFEVDDLEAGMEKVRELGGEAGEPQPTEAGRFSICRDDQGFEFCIWAASGGGARQPERGAG